LTASGVFIFEKVSERVMYPWPVGDFDYAMDEALDIAMDYLERTEQAVKFIEVQSVAAMAILAAWKMGVRHRVGLANIAIKAVKRKTEPFWTIKSAADDEISGHRIQPRSRPRAAFVEMVRVGCGCGDHGPSGN